jgi:hypothetical protein
LEDREVTLESVIWAAGDAFFGWVAGGLRDLANNPTQQPEKSWVAQPKKIGSLRTELRVLSKAYHFFDLGCYFKKYLIESLLGYPTQQPPGSLDRGCAGNGPRECVM